MPVQRGPTQAQIAQAIIAELAAPIPFDEFVQRILERHSSKAKNPAQLVRTNLRYELQRLSAVLLDNKMITPLRLAMQGVRFRIPLDAEQLKHGAIWQEWCAPFFKSSYGYRTKFELPIFLDVDSHPVLTQSIALTMKPARPSKDDLFSMFWGENDTIELKGFELGSWLRMQKAHTGDSLLATVLDWEDGHIRLEHEPRTKRREAKIKAQNRALSDMIYTLLQETTDEKLLTHYGVATAYARLTSARDYPGDHWHNVLEQDGRMSDLIGMIVPADYQSPFEMTLEPDSAVKEKPYAKIQSQKVYRFQAQAGYAKKKRVIEMLGKHTLGIFDDVMREAFDLDAMDHLSEFTRIIRRGAGKRPHESPYGELNPFESTPAAKVHLAGLGLEIGAELQYVYDFGDWLEHRLTLENIGEQEQDVNYPRFTNLPSPKRGRKPKAE
jgi:hypothetical protein